MKRHGATMAGDGRGLGSRGLAAFLFALIAHAATASPGITIVERPLNIDSDPGYEALELRCDVMFDGPGRYRLLPMLADPHPLFGPEFSRVALASGRSPLAKPKDAGDAGPWFTVTTDSIGHARFTAYFYCDGLYRMDRDGPWKLAVRYARVGDLSGASTTPVAGEEKTRFLECSTRAWSRAQFDFNYQGDLAPPDYSPFDESPPGQALVFTQGYDLLVGTVVSADSGGTQGRPPVIQLQVEEVLHGPARAGRVSVRWNPIELYIPCAVGEEKGIKRWSNTPYPPPAIGTRWILGGHPSGVDSVWDNLVECRWQWSDTLRDYFVSEARHWVPRLRRLREKRDEAIRLARWRAEFEARRAQARSDSVQVVRENAWLARQRTLARSADVADLVARSTRVVVGRLTHPRSFTDLLNFDLQVSETLLEGPDDTSTVIPIFVGAREDSLVSFWDPLQRNITLGRQGRRPFQCIAFLCETLVRNGDRPQPACRIVSAHEGLLLADAATIGRVHDALNSGTSAPTGASWADVVRGIDPASLVLDVKLSPLSRGNSYATWSALVLSCGHEASRGWVLSRALPPSRYYGEIHWGEGDLAAQPADMAALLDSLSSFPSLRAERADPNDLVSLTVRRVNAGREAQVECTLDRSEFLQLTRVVTNIFNRWVTDPSSGRMVPADATFNEGLWAWFQASGRESAAVWDGRSLR